MATNESTRENGPGHDESTASEQTHSTPVSTSDLPGNTAAVLEVLRSNDGLTYLKARDVARETDLTRQQAGSALGRLAQMDIDGLEIEKWGITAQGYTWRIAPVETDGGIDAEKLRSLKYADSSTPEDERVRCAECEGINLRPIHGEKPGFKPKDPDADYYCETCEDHVDVIRPVTDGGIVKAGTLQAADVVETEAGEVLTLKGSNLTVTFEVPPPRVAALLDVIEDLPADDPEARTDGGAIDHEFEEAEQSPREYLEEALAQTDAPRHDQLAPGDLAIDLVTRQPLYILDETAPSLVEFYDEEGFDIATYKQHAWLPVCLDDPVFECIFLGGVDDLHNFSNTYDYPAGRLARIPWELAVVGGEE